MIALFNAVSEAVTRVLAFAIGELEAGCRRKQAYQRDRQLYLLRLRHQAHQAGMHELDFVEKCLLCLMDVEIDEPYVPTKLRRG